MEKLQVIEQQGLRVLTTKQLAEAYGVEEKVLRNNFTRNQKRYVEGKHFIRAEGSELKALKGTPQIDVIPKYANTLYLWTERGALLHAKSLNNDTAWQVYDWLVDFYYRAKREKTAVKQPERCDISGDVNVQEQMNRIRDLATSVNGVLEVTNRNMHRDEFPAYQETLYGLCAELCFTAFRFKKISPKILQEN